VGCRIEATFEDEAKELLFAAKCTTFVIVELPATSPGGSRKRSFGTAFFVSPKLLLTAGHNVLGAQGPLKSVKITTPGLVHVTWNMLSSNRLATIDCSVLGTLYSGKQGKDSYLTDIAILHSGSYTAGEYLPISAEETAPGTGVSVIGYPGPAKEGWLGIHEGLQNVEASRLITDQMFPARRLTVSSGTIESTTGNIAYKLSTMPGMSGSPVLSHGTAIGTNPIP